MIPHKNPHEGATWESIRDRLCTPKQIAAAEKFAEKVSREIEAREARERVAFAKPPVGTHRPQGEQLAVAGA